MFTIILRGAFWVRAKQIINSLASMFVFRDFLYGLVHVLTSPQNLRPTATLTRMSTSCVYKMNLLLFMLRLAQWHGGQQCRHVLIQLHRAIEACRTLDWTGSGHALDRTCLAPQYGCVLDRTCPGLDTPLAWMHPGHALDRTCRVSQSGCALAWTRPIFARVSTGLDTTLAGHTGHFPYWTYVVQDTLQAGRDPDYNFKVAPRKSLSMHFELF